MKLPDYKKAKEVLKEERKIIRYHDSFSSLGINKKYFIKTYGCQMNEHDTENIKAILEAMGFEETSSYETADLVILNTCSIRENAHNKAFGMIGRLKHLKEKKKLYLGIGGCMPQEEAVAQKLLKEKTVDFVFGTHNIYQLPDILTRVISGKRTIFVESKAGEVIEDIPFKRESSFKAYVNIIYGCDKFCTYCIVPFTRGRERSRAKDDILTEIKLLKHQGYKEVTLLGQNVNAYGKDLSDNYYLSNLLEDVAQTGIERIKFMTSHPWDFTDDLIEVIAKYENIAPAIHLPLQSGSDKILKLMGRRYTSLEYETLVAKMRKKIPNLSLSTDIIVGFPQETEEDFEKTLQLVKRMDYDMAFSFIYSVRVGTAAEILKDHVDEAVAKERLYRLNEVLNASFLKNNQKMIGKTLAVLIEDKSNKKGHYFGYSQNNKLVNVLTEEDLIGQIIDVEITEAKTWSLDGRINK